MKLDAMLPVVRKQLLLKAHAHRADDICTAIRITKEFDLKLTLEHVTEGQFILPPAAGGQRTAGRWAESARQQ